MMPGWVHRKIDSVGRSLLAPLRGAVSVLSAKYESPIASASFNALTSRTHREMFYSAAVHSTSLAILTTDNDGIITGWNQGARRLFGYWEEEAIGRAVEMLIPQDRKMEMAEILAHCRAGNRTDNFATVQTGKDGRPVHVVIDISPLKTLADARIGALAIIRDVSDQRLAEELFGLAVDASPSGMMMIDKHGRIVMVNNEIEHLFRYQRQELLGRPVEMLVPRDLRVGDGKLWAEYGEQSMNLGVGKERELSGMRKDGTSFVAETKLNAVCTRDGVLILASIVDVSQRKHNERVKDEFVSTVSHELRTPLTSLTASLALLSAGQAGQLSETATRLVSIAHNNGQRLVRLVNDILDIEKFDSGKTKFTFTQVNARAVVEQAIDMCRAYAAEFGVTVRLDQNSVTGEVRADSDRLTQVITNLLSNAIKFSPRGQEVVAALVERDGKIRVTVRDKGPGIPDNFKPRVFEKFAQADASDARKKGGTGLGLSIVKEIVNRFGGEVGFESGPGQGTLFYVDLLAWGPDTEIECHDLAHGMEIMLCEDDLDVAAILVAKLGKAGFNALATATVSDALHHADHTNYAAVLVDLNLPDGDGLELIQHLRTRPRYQDKPIVVISANSKSGRDDLRSAALDVLDWLDKPVDMDRLVDVLGRSIVTDKAPDDNPITPGTGQAITKEVA